MKKRLLIAVVLCALVLGSWFAFAGLEPWNKSTDSVVTQCVAVTNASAQYTLPRGGEWYMVVAHGTDVYLLGGTNPTTTVTVGSGHFAVVDQGTQQWHRLTGPKIAHIASATVAGAEVCFIRQNTQP